VYRHCDTPLFSPLIGHSPADSTHPATDTIAASPKIRQKSRQISRRLKTAEQHFFERRQGEVKGFV
jgi:hypothetical protein